MFPSAKAILTIPFWLKFAPGPISVKNRHKLLKDIAGQLNDNNADPFPSAKWEVLELGWCREPYSVERQKTWHPKPAVNRKGWILKGTFLDDGLDEIIKKLRSHQREIECKIRECSIFYFDYGICALEYVFEFRPVAIPPDPNWVDSPFWGNFKKQIMAAVEDRNLGLLKEERWYHTQKALVDAFCVASKRLPSPSRIVPFYEIFGARKDNRGHLAASFGINFILFGDLGAHILGPPSPELKRTVTRLIGRPIGSDDGGARSEDLAYVLYGAVHTLVIIRRHPDTKEAAGAVEAVRVMLRSLWMGYSVLAEAPRGLMELQGDYYLGYKRRHGAVHVRREVEKLDRAGQTFELLIAEFHFSMFWESEIEYDIYHAAYEQWRMKELAEFVKDSLKGAAKTAEILQRTLDKKRQRNISILLGVLATLTIIGATANIFSLSKAEWDNFQYHRPSFLDFDEYRMYHPLVISVLALCGFFGFIIFLLNQEWFSLRSIGTYLSLKRVRRRPRPR